MMNRLSAAMLIVAGAGFLVGGCEGPQNQGQAKSYRIESRLPSEGTALGSGDLTTATEHAVEGIIASAHFERNEGGATVIVMDRVENKTSDRSADYQIYLARIRALLNQVGSDQGLVFVETRAKAEAIREREGYPAGSSHRAVPQYALTATFYDLPSGRTNYHLLTFQMVDFRDGLLIWEGYHEVKL